MAVTFESFTTKWFQDFGDLLEVEFNGMLPTVLREIELVDWKTLKDDATEMLLGYKLLMKSSENQSSIKSFSRDDKGFEVSYTDEKQALKASWYGAEYERLRTLVTVELNDTLKKAKNRSYIGQRPTVTIPQPLPDRSPYQSRRWFQG